MVRLAWCMVAISVLLVPCGCNSSSTSPHKENTFPVSGTVTLDGEPLADGEIHFLSPQMGTLDIVKIAAGKFQGEAKAGDRRVEIRAYKDEERKPTEGEPTMPGADEASRVNYLPARYNSQSELKAPVTEAGPNEFTFELTSD